MSFDRNQLPDPATYFEELGHKLKGPHRAKWKSTNCPFHGGSDSMRINTTSGAWVCMSCGVKGGDVLSFEMQVRKLDFVEAAKALGAWVDDGKSTTRCRPSPLPPRAALEVLSFEATLAAVAAGNIARGLALTESDRKRLLTAANRINKVAEAFA